MTLLTSAFRALPGDAGHRQHLPWEKNIRLNCVSGQLFSAAAVANLEYRIPASFQINTVPVRLSKG
jgi:hypothetical protein